MLRAIFSFRSPCREHRRNPEISQILDNFMKNMRKT